MRALPTASRGRRRLSLAVVLLPAPFVLAAAVSARSGEVERLVAALLGDTPLVQDLQSLTDEVGGRPTGSPANLKAIEWGLDRFRQAGVEARKETFAMPALWLERSVRVTVGGDLSFNLSAAAMPFSAGTPAAGLTAALVDAGRGGEKDFARLAATARGAWVLVETEELADLDGLFREYTEATEIERRAFAAGAGGVAYMASRPHNLLYRHNASLAEKNRHPMLILEREGAERALRLLRSGKRLNLTATIDVQSGGPYESANVVGEVRGAEKPDEFVVVGAHLDSWDLGTGALDNGCNVALVIDLARQFKALGLRPKRTVRFVLWNGEEQGMYGSWGYTKTHQAEMDRHVMAASFDIGSGRIRGFFTGGRAEILPVVDRGLQAVQGLGPFTQTNEPIVGTDNFDFMLEGVANLVADQESANYGPNYHARSDTFDKVDLRQLRLNAAIAGAVTYAFADADVGWARQSRADVERLVNNTSLKDQMSSFGMLESWNDGKRGRKP
jgi:carboxypeptidase Q